MTQRAHGGFLTVRALQAAGAARSGRWHDGQGRPWSLLEWAGAMCGEAGEAANVAKKILRIDLGVGGNEAAEHVITDRAELVRKLAGEISGTILYAERLATEAGIDLEQALIETFNEKSIALGFPDRLSGEQLEVSLL